MPQHKTFLGQNIRNLYQVPKEKEPMYSGLKKNQGRRLLQERRYQPYGAAILSEENQNGAMGSRLSQPAAEKDRGSRAQLKKILS